MTREQALRIRTLVLVLFMVVCGNIGDLMLKRGMRDVGPVSLSAEGIAHSLRLTATSPQIWLAILFLLGFLASYMTAVSGADYSYVMPVGSFGYALITILAVIFLGDVVSPRRWIGVALICAGVLMVGETSPRTTVAKQ